MDYYQSDRPPADDTGLSGGVLFNFGGVIATATETAPIQRGAGGFDGWGKPNPDEGGAVALPYESHTGNATAGYNVVFEPVNELKITNGTHNVTMNIGSLDGHDASFRTIIVCDNGSPKYMKILGSATYPIP